MKLQISVALPCLVLWSLSGCATKEAPKAEEAAAPIAAPEKANPLALEVEQIDYSNRLIDDTFEQQLLSPLRKFEAARSNNGGAEAAMSSLVCQGKLRKRQPEGRWICKSPDNKRVLAVEFRNSKKQGWLREWNEFGKLKAESWWRNDQLSSSAKVFHDNGEKNIAGAYRKGLRNGLFVKYDERGKKLADVMYHKGKREGWTRELYANGKVKVRLNYQSDQPNGEYSSWYESGSLKAHGFLKNGAPHRKWEHWNELGESTLNQEISP